MEIITTTTPTPQLANAPNNVEKEEEIRKEEPTLLGKMRMMDRKREEENKLTGTRKKQTPGRKTNNRKKEEEKEVPMKKLMMNWVKKEGLKEENKEQKGVKALRDKFNQKTDNTNTYDEWKRMKE